MKIHLIIWSIFLSSTLLLAQDTTKHDPLVDPFGHYPIFTNSIEIAAITDSSIGGTRIRVGSLKQAHPISPIPDIKN
jgi:hypothetical protein